VALFDAEEATLRLAAAEGCPREVTDVLRCQHADRSVPTAEAVRTGRPIWLSGRAEVELRAPQLARADPEARSLALLPVRTDGRTLAAAGLRFTAERRLEPSDQVYALALARLCAQALERALRYEREREVAEILQRSLLPRELAQLPGAEVAMRYLPAVDGIAVGGDWYESIELPGGRVGLAVGDVVGRGVEAAAVMGQLRSAMRAFALDGDPPHRVLERLSRFAAGIEGGRATTVAYAIVDPESGDLRYACAGHPPPLVVAPDGTAGYLVDGRSVPLAAGLGDDSYREGRSSLGVGSTLVLYSDGAIERRGESVDAGLGWLRQTVATAPEVDPESLCTHLLERLSDERPPRDDVALVALRLSPRPATPLALSAPADPSRVSGVRRTVLTWLERSGLAGQTAHDIVLACGEACANAAEHAYADGEDGAVEVEVHGEGADEIVLRVRDFGRWRPPPDDPGDRGRGFLIMRQVMDGLEVVSGPDGTEVVMRRRVGPIARGGDAEAGSREEGAPAAAPAVDGPRAALARLVVERVAGRTVAHLGGEVDASNAADLGARLLGTLENAGSGLVVDLSDLAYLDSAGIRMVGELARRSHGAVRLLLPPESLLRGIVEIASIEAIAPVVQSLDEAADPAGA
jgi:anti-anti-sigma factor